MTRNLVDQFKKAPTVASAPGTSVSSSSTTTLQTKATVGQWFQKNWGKAAAIFIVVIISTIFIVRTVLIAKNKKKTRVGSAGAPALNQNVEWESFLSHEPVQPPPPMPRAMVPPHVMQQLSPMHHAPVQPRMQPPQVPPHVAQQVPQAVIERGLHQQRLPPADGVSAGMIPSMMPQSSRPQNVTFTIDSAPPVVAAPEKDEAKKLDGEEPQLMPPDVDTPTAGTEFNR